MSLSPKIKIKTFDVCVKAFAQTFFILGWTFYAFCLFLLLTSLKH